ncbi:MAG: HAMP domain-containing sensor histidine kinase [Bacteroidales bacterium]|nr:HAMP domain-containing sensor histidine kinase [Bacteroidales bacterium]
MLNRALTFSIIAILFLLALQGVWLFRIIESEKTEFRKNADLLLNESINKELNSRLLSMNKGKGFNVSISNTLSENTKKNERKIVDVDIKKDQKSLTRVTLEQALQEAFKKDLPLKLDTLAIYFTKSLSSAEKTTSFILKFTSPDTVKIFESTTKKDGIAILIPSFETTIPLTVSKDLLITATIFYPTSVFKGDLLTILVLSLIVTIFILFSIIMQTRMLYKQVSLAKVKENITNFLTHELRSPLQSSITNLEVGEMSEGANSKYFLGKAKEQLNFLNGLIENILDINKFEKRQAPLNKALFNINEAIEPHIVRHSVDSKKTVHISANTEPGREMLFGDKLHITNAIGNLIDNAIKYSDDPVVITVTTNTIGSYFRIIVEDNGIGIPKEEQSKVFEKFYRVSKREHSQKGKGFGLGLTYVMWVVKAHKGKIELESEVGVGSKFILSLKNDENGTEDTAGR